MFTPHCVANLCGFHRNKLNLLTTILRILLELTSDKRASLIIPVVRNLKLVKRSPSSGISDLSSNSNLIYCIHFRTNDLGKGTYPSLLSSGVY